MACSGTALPFFCIIIIIIIIGEEGLMILKPQPLSINCQTAF
jgi:hypothetical protein